VFRHDIPNNNNACYNCLYTEQDENLENCAGQGILGSVVGTIGCMMATEAVKLLIGLESSLNGKLWVYDALGGITKTIGIKRRAECPVCGSKGV
jgi:molybdopterin/thiamine biosynthesis adenylyltransferase